MHKIFHTDANFQSDATDGIYVLWEREGLRLHSGYKEFLYILQGGLVVAALGIVPYVEEEMVRVFIVVDGGHRRKGMAAALIGKAEEFLHSDLSRGSHGVRAELINPQVLRPLLQRRGWNSPLGSIMEKYIFFDVPGGRSQKGRGRRGTRQVS